MKEEHMNDRLLYCVVCDFDKAAFEKHKDYMIGAYETPEWDNYKPILFKDRITGEWIIECQNCGMHMMLHENTPEETAEQWNSIKRRMM